MLFTREILKRSGGLTLPSPKERVLKKDDIFKVLSFGEDLGEAKTPGELLSERHRMCKCADFCLLRN
jgi:hypothetical protein